MSSTLTIWVDWRFGKERKDEGSRGDSIAYREFIAREQVDCALKRHRTLRGAYYDSSGNVVSRTEQDSTRIQWLEPIPDTFGELLIKAVCAYPITPRPGVPVRVPTKP